jgi:UDP-N-acetylglucosamine--N-acetylmuramyl-(pentapeptide) pyrophosphoryl-undecaprenol N-acetylglucosamine transferase
MAGGGTGGHIYPAITIAKTIAAMAPNCQLLFIGTSQGLEADVVPREGFDLITIDARGFERRLSLGTVRTVLATLADLVQSLRIIRRFRPDIVIGTGGYTCGPVLLAARILGLPTLIQEQNVIPGVTNRILARFAGCVAVGYEEAAAYFGRQAKVVVTGNPIRPEVVTAERTAGIAALGLDAGRLTLLTVGGSRGARSINNAMLAVHRHFAGRDDIQLLHVTGQNEYNNIIDGLAQAGIDISRIGNISIRPYMYDMPLALAAADIAVSRAGALGLAELTARGIPAILVPYPYAAENHQEYNARVLERRGAAVVIRDADLTGQVLVEAVEDLIRRRDRLATMATASKSLGRPAAAAAIASLAIELADSHSDKSK